MTIPTETGTYLEDLCNAIVTQLVTVTGLASTNVYLVDQEMPQPKLQKNVQQISVWPSQFGPDVGQQTGGSEYGTTLNFVIVGVFVVDFWAFHAVDQVGQSPQFLTDTSQWTNQPAATPKGILPFMRLGILALEQFNPQYAGSPPNNMLQEPMRMSPGGFQLMPGAAGSLRRLRTEWSVGFIQALP